jgi:hypothetical protein
LSNPSALNPSRHHLAFWASGFPGLSGSGHLAQHLLAKLNNWPAPWFASKAMPWGESVVSNLEPRDDKATMSDHPFHDRVTHVYLLTNSTFKGNFERT